MSAFFKKIIDVLAPENPGKEASSANASASGQMSRQAVLDALVNHFDQEMDFESTKVSMLFHTSYVVYLREADYERISPSFLMTANDAVTMFLDRVKNSMRKYPSYQPHSRYWVFQLVSIPEGTVIEGMPEDDIESGMILVKSTLFPDDDYESGGEGGGRVVTTMHTKNSMVALPKAVNMQALLGLDQLDKDKFRIRFDQNNVLGFASGAAVAAGGAPMPPGIPSAQMEPVGRLTADDGRFVGAGRLFTTYQMRSDTVRICGRNGVAIPGEPIVCVDNDKVMNPHCMIRRDAATDRFFIAAQGPVKLNERRLIQGQWTPLPDKSVILLNDDIQISFRSRI